MKTKNLKHKLFSLMAIGFSIFLLFYFITSIWIGYEVKQICQDAKWKYRTADCVDALTAQLNDKNEGYRFKNHAIWALGQIGDRRAMPVLQRYYTGTIPEREPLDDMISQYELKKALNLAAGGLNITAWVWR